MSGYEEVNSEERSDNAVERTVDSNQRSLERWIPFVPLLAVAIVACVFLIYANILQ